MSPSCVTISCEVGTELGFLMCLLERCFAFSTIKSLLQSFRLAQQAVKVTGFSMTHWSRDAYTTVGSHHVVWVIQGPFGASVKKKKEIG